MIEIARIMLVDDSNYMRATLRAAFEKAGHEVVVEADNGEDAVDLYAKHRPIYPQTNLPYATIVSLGDRKVEIRSERAIMNSRKLTIFDKEGMEKLAPISSAFGIKALADSHLGYGFDLDFDVLSKTLGTIKGKSGKSTFDVADDLNTKYPIVKEQEEATREISGSWDKNSSLYLFTEDEESKSAYPIDNISTFMVEADTDSIIPWQSSSSARGYFFVSVTDPNEGEIVFQIPSSSYLLAVAKDNVVNETEGAFISLNRERIPIRSFQQLRK